MSDLQTMRTTWRPRLAHGVTINAIGLPWVALAVALFQPEAGAHAVAVLVAVFGLAASLFGLRQWGKNAGSE